MSSMLAPRDWSKTAWKTVQGPTTSIVSAPRPMMKATGILPCAGGTSLVEGGIGGCWLYASPGKEMKAMKTIDSLFSLLYIDVAYIRAANPVPRRFRVGRKLEATAAFSWARMKRLRVTPITEHLSGSSISFLLV